MLSTAAAAPAKRAAPLLLASVLALAGCTADGEQRARDRAFADARETVRDAETADIGRGDLGPGAVAYLRSAIEADGDRVLDSWSTPGTAAAGDLVGWVDAALTRRSSNTASESGATATVCLRFEVRWSDRTGASYEVREVDC